MLNIESSIPPGTGIENGSVKWKAQLSIGQPRPRKVALLERWIGFFGNFSGWSELIYSVLERDFRKLNGSYP